MTTTITTVSANGSSLDVEWSDGEKSSFNFLWLRDNCPSEIHKTARERTFNILNISENIAPESFKISEDGKLEVKWNEDKHVSYYEPSWLRKNCYTIKRKKAYVSPYILWDKTLNSQMPEIQINCDVIMKNDEGLIKWLELLHYYGIAIIKNAPTEKKSALKILDKISHTRQTFFDTPFEVINIPKPNNSAYTASALHNHMDLPYFETPPGYQFLHCLVNDAEGGNSSAVDGFKVADYLKHNDKETFNILKRIPIKFVNKDYTQNKLRVFHAPAITLTKDGDYNDIRFSITYMGVIDCSSEDMEPFYKAHYKFAKLIHNEKFNIKFRLEAGDIFCFNNRRILHGRTEYNPNLGNRHLQGYYIDRDEIISRLNYLKKIDTSLL